MNQTRSGSIVRSLRTVCVLLLFAGYFFLVAMKSPFDFTDPEFETPASDQGKLQMVIANEPFDHLRTASASILLGLLAAGALVSPTSLRGRRYGLALLASSSLLIASTFLGHSALAVQPILVLLGLHGALRSLVHIRRRGLNAS